MNETLYAAIYLVRNDKTTPAAHQAKVQPKG